MNCPFAATTIENFLLLLTKVALQDNLVLLSWGQLTTVTQYTADLTNFLVENNHSINLIWRTPSVTLPSWLLCKIKVLKHCLLVGPQKFLDFGIWGWDVVVRKGGFLAKWFVGGQNKSRKWFAHQSSLSAISSYARDAPKSRILSTSLLLRPKPPLASYYSWRTNYSSCYNLQRD